MSDPQTPAASRPAVGANAVPQPEFATLAARARRRRRRRLGAWIVAFVGVVAAGVAVPVLAVPVLADWRSGRGVRIGAAHSSADFTARAGAVVDQWQRGGMAYTYRWASFRRTT